MTGASLVTALLLLCAATASASSTLTLTATDAVVGQPVQATAELSESPAATGEISFEVFGPGDSTCSGPALDPAPTSASVSGEGEYLSGEITPPEAGTYYWSAHYSGDEGNSPADSTCSATSIIGKASPGLTGNATSAVVGNPIHDSVTVSGGFSPSGEVTFKVYGPTDSGCLTPLATTSAPISGGQAASADFVPQQAGEFRWSAEYPGDANNEAVSLGCEASNQTSTVSKASPALSGTASPAVVGNPIHDAVTVSGGFSPGGEVTFKVFAPTDSGCLTPLATSTAPISGGQAASADFAPQQAGLYRWSAEYPGDTNNESVGLGCEASNQTSTVSKASPALSGTASSVVVVGSPITDTATLSGGFAVVGELVFRAYGPGDPTCANAPSYEASVPVGGPGSYSPPGFSPPTGVYQWTVVYGGDGNNEAVGLGCGTANQSSAVGTVSVTLAASATSGTVGNAVVATATLQEGATPTGQITFKAFPPGDASCSGTPAFSSTVGVSGNGSYSSAAFTPSQVGSYRWTAAYSGDPNHAPATEGCGRAMSDVSAAKPTIVGEIGQGFTVGSPFRVAATLQGGFAPRGKVTFRIYGPPAGDCAKPLAVDTVTVSGNGTVQSDPFVPQQPGHYRFVVGYSGDSANLGAAETCGSPNQMVVAQKRTPKVKPRARLSGRLISIRARLSGAVSPSGSVTFQLYRPGDKRCQRKPAFGGRIAVRANGSYLLAKYLATKSGTYRLSVGYSGDQRNRRQKGNCSGAQTLRVS
jgi:hypothetical protein